MNQSGIPGQSQADSYSNEIEHNGVLHCFVVREGRSGLGYRAGSAKNDSICEDG